MDAAKKLLLGAKPALPMGLVTKPVAHPLHTLLPALWCCHKMDTGDQLLGETDTAQVQLPSDLNSKAAPSIKSAPPLHQIEFLATKTFCASHWQQTQGS